LKENPSDQSFGFFSLWWWT